MHDRPRWLPTRRGAFLILFGGIYTLFGYNLLSIQVTPQIRHAYALILGIAPLWAYATAWLVAAAVAVFAGLTRRLESVAFGCAAFMPLLWAAVYFASWLHDRIPNGWVEATIFAGLAGAVVCVAGMIDPRPVKDVIQTLGDQP